MNLHHLSHLIVVILYAALSLQRSIQLEIIQIIPAGDPRISGPPCRSSNDPGTIHGYAGIASAFLAPRTTDNGMGIYGFSDGGIVGELGRYCG